MIVQNVPAKGTLLDIGAWNPTDKSNSRLLIEAGWSAILIEPSPKPFLDLLKEYGNESRVTLIHAAVGFSSQMVKMHATDDALSTTEEAVYQTWKEVGGYYGSFWTPALTLAELFNQFGGEFHFINIDTEGTSVDIFKGVIQAGVRPQCFCVEHDNRLVEIHGVAQNAGYRQIRLNDTNVIFAV